MNLRDLLKIDLDDPNPTNQELSLKLVAVILRAVAVLVILIKSDNLELHSSGLSLTELSLLMVYGEASSIPHRRIDVTISVI